MIDVRQLTYLIAVVESKSFTAAADVLHIAQPALSQHLRRLEEDVGQQLLVRHSRGIEPTPAGLRLVEHARSILTSVESAKNDVRNFHDEPQTHLRLGIPRSLRDALGVELLTTWSAEHPNVNLQLIEQPSNTLTEWVLAGRLDLAVTSFPSDNNLVVAEPLLQDKLCAVMPGHATVLGEIRFADLARERLILSTSANASRQLIDMTAKYCSVQLNIAYEVDSPELALRLVEANLGSTIQPYLAVKRYMSTNNAVVRLIVGPGITRRLHIIRARHRPLIAHEMAVCNAIKRELIRQLPEETQNPPFELDFASES